MVKLTKKGLLLMPVYAFLLVYSDSYGRNTHYVNSPVLLQHDEPNLSKVLQLELFGVAAPQRVMAYLDGDVLRRAKNSRGDKVSVSRRSTKHAADHSFGARSGHGSGSVKSSDHLKGSRRRRRNLQPQTFAVISRMHSYTPSAYALHQLVQDAVGLLGIGAKYCLRDNSACELVIPVGSLAPFYMSPALLYKHTFPQIKTHFSFCAKAGFIFPFAYLENTDDVSSIEQWVASVSGHAQSFIWERTVGLLAGIECVFPLENHLFLKGSGGVWFPFTGPKSGKLSVQKPQIGLSYCF